MKAENIRPGMKLKIVGSIGGCGEGAHFRKCKDCKDFKKGIIAREIHEAGVFAGKVYAKAINNSSACYFCPKDLELIEINWQKELE